MSIQLSSLQTAIKYCIPTDADLHLKIDAMFALSNAESIIAQMCALGLRAGALLASISTNGQTAPTVTEPITIVNKTCCQYILPKLNRNCKLRAREGSLVCWRHRDKESEIAAITAAAVEEPETPIEKPTAVVKKRPAPIEARAPLIEEEKLEMEPEKVLEKQPAPIAARASPVEEEKLEIESEKPMPVVKKQPAPIAARASPVEEEKLEYTQNRIIILEKFPRVKESTATGCIYSLKSNNRRGENCAKRVAPNSRYCNFHKRYAPADEVSNEEIRLPRVKWTPGEFWNDLVEKRAISALPTKTIVFQEDDNPGDNDSIIDDAIAVPKFVTRECIFYDEASPFCSSTRLALCGAPVSARGSCVCNEHKKHAKKFTPNPSLWNSIDSYAMALQPFPDTNMISGNLWFPRLNLFAHATIGGPIVVGKAWCAGVYCETLEGCGVAKNMDYSLDAAAGRDEEESDLYGGYRFMDGDKEQRHLAKYCKDNDVCDGAEDSAVWIRRCHNNGLLYKVLPQSMVHKQYDLPNDLDQIEGYGMTSFEQMIKERPTLYIKYWNVWNRQIQRARDFMKYRGRSLIDLNAELGIEKAIDWDKYENELGWLAGMFNIIVPAPALEQVTAPNFNPFRYCKEWVAANCAQEDRTRPHFPPMYLLYPFPDDRMESEWLGQNKPRPERRIKANRKLIQHYHKSGRSETPEAWLQWLKFGAYDSVFDLFQPGARTDIPAEWVNRLSEKK